MQDLQQYQDESAQLKTAIKIKQENQRVKIRKEKVNKALQFIRLKFISKDDPDLVNQDQNYDIVSLVHNEALVAQKLNELSIGFEQKDYNTCLEVVRFFARIKESSLEVLNKTDFGLYLISFIDLDFFHNNYDLFLISLKILQNIPFRSDDAQINKLVEFRLIEHLLQVIDIKQNDNAVNCALFSLSNICGTNKTKVVKKLMELNGISVIERLNEQSVFQENLLFLYQNIFGNISADIQDFSEEDQESIQKVISYLLNRLRIGYEVKNETDIEQALWGLSGLARMQALVYLNDDKDYILLSNIFEGLTNDKFIPPILQIINSLIFNSDKNIEVFVSFDFLTKLMYYCDHKNHFYRTQTIYSFMNMAACESESIKNVLLDQTLVSKLIVMMQFDKPNIQKVCALFFMNLIQDSGENFVRKSIQDYLFMDIAKQILDQIRDFEVIQKLLKTFEYIFECVSSDEIIAFIIHKMDHFKINEYIDDLTNTNQSEISDKANTVLNMYNEKKEQLGIE